MRHAIDNLTGTQSVGIVCVGNVRGAIVRRSEAPSILPCESPAGAVVVAQGIAAGIVIDG